MMATMHRFIALLAIPLGFAATAAARTIVVAPVAGQAGAHPIAAAVKAARPGDEIVLREGVYDESLELDKSGEPERPIALRAQGRVTLHPSAAKNTPSPAIVLRGVSFWIVDGLEITGHSQGIKLKDCHDVTIRNCHIHDGGSGLDIEGESAARIVIEDVRLENHEAGGLDVAKGVTLEEFTVRNCVASRNRCKGGSDGFGISHKTTVKNVRFENCTADHNGSDGFDLGGQGGVVLLNCIAHHNGQSSWGDNFKCWNGGSKFINCLAYATGKSSDANFELIGDDIEMIHCTSGVNGDAGIVVGGKNARLTNCLIADARRFALHLKKETASCAADHCLVSACGDPGALDVTRNANIVADAKLVDAAQGDYRISRDSPAAGKAKALDEIKTDLAGRPRPKAPAIGAYEPAPDGK